MFSVRRLTLWPRHVRPELVGFLLHPVSRSETWRRLGTWRISLPNPLGFHSKSAAQSPWRGAELPAAISWRTCPGLAGRADLEEPELRKRTFKLYPIRAIFSRVFDRKPTDKSSSYSRLQRARCLWKICCASKTTFEFGCCNLGLCRARFVLSNKIEIKCAWA